MTMSSIIWILAVFWAALPVFGWGVFDFEPMKTCCTLDYTQGDRYMRLTAEHKHTNRLHS